MSEPAIHNADIDFLIQSGANPQQYETLLHMGASFDGPIEMVGDTPMHPVSGKEKGERAQRAEMDAILLRGLRDLRPGETRRTGLHLFRHAMRNAPGSVTTVIDEVSHALLRAMRVSPAWLLLLSHLFDGQKTNIWLNGWSGNSDLAFGQIREDDEQMLALSILIGPDVVWNGEGVLVRGLPDTILSSAEGRPLREIVSHPVIDTYDLIVRDVRPDGMLDVGYVPYRKVDWESRNQLSLA